MPITHIVQNSAILRSTQLVSLSPGQEEVQRHNLESTVLYLRSIGFVMYVTEDRKLEEIAMIFLAIVLAKAALSDCRLLAKSFSSFV